MKDSVQTDMLRTVFDAMPSLIFVVDDDVRVQEYNSAAADLLSAQRPAILKQRGGDVLCCLHAIESPEGCGHASFCKKCVIRNSVAEAFRGGRVLRRRARLEIIREGKKEEIYGLITATPFHYQERPLALLVIEDISTIAELKQLIPICSVCRRIRDDKESWSLVEAYFKEHWDIEFSHGLCPECYQIELQRLKKET